MKKSNEKNMESDDQKHRRVMNDLIKIQITLNSLKDIVKTKDIKATLWTKGSSIECSELLMNIPKLQKKAVKKIKELTNDKNSIIKSLRKSSREKVLLFLEEDITIKQSARLYL